MNKDSVLLDRNLFGQNKCVFIISKPFNNYSLKWRLLVVNIYQAVSGALYILC